MPATAMPGAGPNAAAPVLRIHPTRRCNLACGHCISASGPQVTETLPRELIHAALKDAAALGYEDLVISGGEPFLYGGLPGLLARARRLEYRTTVVTNGMLLAQARRWAPVAPMIDFLSVSLDGGAAEHDARRGRDGVYDQVIAGLGHVRASGVAFGFAFTLTRGNADCLETVVRIAAEQGAESVRVQPLRLLGRAAETMRGQRPEGDDLTGAMADAVRLGREHGVAVEIDAVTRDELVLYRGEFVPPGRARDLTELAPTLLIESDGRVMPLTDGLPARLRLGSLLRSRLGTMAGEWLASDRAAELAAACDRTWWELADPAAPAAAAWADEVALRIAEAPTLPMLVAA